jgi:hypothetical protein
LDLNEEHAILADIAGLRRDCDGDDNLIKLIQKYEKRKVGNTKIVLEKREEFYLRKYKSGIKALLELNSKYYYLKYLEPQPDVNDPLPKNSK